MQNLSQTSKFPPDRKPLFITLCVDNTDNCAYIESLAVTNYSWLPVTTVAAGVTEKLGVLYSVINLATI